MIKWPYWLTEVWSGASAFRLALDSELLRIRHEITLDFLKKSEEEIDKLFKDKEFVGLKFTTFPIKISSETLKDITND